MRYSTINRAAVVNSVSNGDTDSVPIDGSLETFVQA